MPSRSLIRRSSTSGGHSQLKRDDSPACQAFWKKKQVTPFLCFCQTLNSEGMGLHCTGWPRAGFSGLHRPPNHCSTRPIQSRFRNRHRGLRAEEESSGGAQPATYVQNDVASLEQQLSEVRLPAVDICHRPCVLRHSTSTANDCHVPMHITAASTVNLPHRQRTR